MTIPSINSLTAGAQKIDTEITATPEQRKVAQQFEAIFLRQILNGLQKGVSHGGDGSGSQLYRSMMVGSVADSASESGGIGLSEVILRAMLPPPQPLASGLSQDATVDVTASGQSVELTSEAGSNGKFEPVAHKEEGL